MVGHRFDHEHRGLHGPRPEPVFLTRVRQSLASANFAWRVASAAARKRTGSRSPILAAAIIRRREALCRQPPKLRSLGQSLQVRRTLQGRNRLAWPLHSPQVSLPCHRARRPFPRRARHSEVRASRLRRSGSATLRSRSRAEGARRLIERAFNSSLDRSAELIQRFLAPQVSWEAL